MLPWDGYDAYLFDIDGTLLHCTDATHYFAFCDTLTHLAGRSLNLDGVVAHGNTDVGILRDALIRNGVEDPSWRPQIAEARERMCRFVAEREKSLCAEVLPGVRKVLAHLSSLGSVLGVASGNLREIGWMKLKCCGLDEHFSFGGFSDAYEYRRDIFRAALEEARRRTRPDASICVFGDTPADVYAAHENRMDSIAVATGIYSWEELTLASPRLCLHSLTELFADEAAPAA
ncbi:MAG TPA: HAD family hydrolase [Acidobacteriaceae bacterium]|jgi:phosphoglycolate phosphatase-like HAD superfamily hydrolase